jgi:hypothetical protein
MQLAFHHGPLRQEAPNTLCAPQPEREIAERIEQGIRQRCAKTAKSDDERRRTA